MKTYHYKIAVEMVVQVRAADEHDLREELNELFFRDDARLKLGFPLETTICGDCRQIVNVLPQELPDPFLIEEEGDNASLDILEDESLEEREVL